MTILIIEDEEAAAAQLMKMLVRQFEKPLFAPVIDNIKDAKRYLASPPLPDLIFLDIELTDGLSFEIFADMQVDVPVIFTTAYDHYAVRAFELNSIDYLLKPFREERLERAINKLKTRTAGNTPAGGGIAAAALLLQNAALYRQNFLVPYLDRLVPVHAGEIAWFEIRNGLVRGMTFEKILHVMEERSLDELEATLDPAIFFRANRQYLMSRKAVKDVRQYFNGRLYVNILPPPSEKILISKARAGEFKDWMKST